MSDMATCIDENLKTIAEQIVQLKENIILNYNFEISLTGSKMQAFAAAVFSSVCKVAQCWYVKPSKFDTNHFTKGVADTKWYTVKIPKY